MKLSDKIYHCRKKAGLSQEALAEKIGVSRQAISKWETNEASPEISKLPLLARTFGVTADWLLDDSAEPEEASPHEAPAPSDAEIPEASQGADRPTAPVYPAWVDHLPGFLGRMLKKYGWIFGLRMAVSGALFTAMGFVGKAMFSSMNSMVPSMGSMFPATQNAGVTFFDEAGNMVDPSALGITDLSPFGITGSSTFSITTKLSNPADILCNFMILIGLVLLIGGILLALYLKKKGQESA